MSLFSAGEWQQYQRHIQLNEVGVDGQFRLKNAKVLVVGAGGLGCPVAMYLGAAGVGEITIIDGDSVSQSNLHRQVLYAYTDIGKPKASVAAKKVKQNNPFISVSALTTHLSASNIDELIAKVDIVLDCTDNFATRLLLNDACLAHRKPWVYASVLGLEGQLALFIPSSACFRCVFPDMPTDVSDCNSAGVLSTVPGVVGLLQANTCLSYLLNPQAQNISQLLLFSGKNNQIRSINLLQNPQCDGCAPSVRGAAKTALRYNRSNETKQAELNTPTLADEVKMREAEKSLLTLGPQVFVQQLLAVINLKGSSDSALSYHAVLLDVRNADEHRGFNIGGQCLPLSVDFTDVFQAQHTGKSDSIFIYCQSGKRSYQAASRLQAMGYKRVYSLEGGLGELLRHPQLVEKL
jgi:adenylyltransferase/sulfurtransferase